MMVGKHVIKTWSTTQSIIALSSGEAELYALVKGASQSLGLVSLAGDFGREMGARIWSDSSAAIAISSRKGLGKVRHVRVQTLWIQDLIKSGGVGVHKVAGEDNMSDILTKHVDCATLIRHLASMRFMTLAGRANTQPTLAQLQALEAYDLETSEGIYTIQHNNTTQHITTTATTAHDGLVWLGELSEQQVSEVLAKLDNCDATAGACEHGDEPKLTADQPCDTWSEAMATCTRVHRCARQKLFTPLRVASGPAAKSIFAMRLTVGKYTETGEEFRFLDSWHAREAAHRDLGAPWTGFIQFMKRSEPARA
jgi:hypothetical protein